MSRSPELPDARHLAALARPAPRYTSYPSVPHWLGDVGPDDVLEALQVEDRPMALYLHVPFCWKACHYCGCNMVVSRRQSSGDRYVDAMLRQIDTVRAGLRVQRIHLGGGTPTWLSPEQMSRLFDRIEGRFELVGDAELSIEVHPGVTSSEHLDLLAEHGFSRISIGVQSTDARVLDAIGRVQTHDDVWEIAHGARSRGFTGLNLDLVYGLPHQDLRTLDRTLDQVIELRPDRLALYGYAHLPWLRKNQAHIDESALPDELMRTELFLHATRRLREAGWESLGLDHFAHPSDPLYRAFAAGRLSRDFMGYTDRSAPLLGLGPSAISELGGLYAQQPSHLGAWYRAIEGGQTLPITRGHRLSEDDAHRRALIRELMCHLRVDRPLPDGTEARLQPWIAAGAVRLDDSALEVTELGRLLLRNVAACFDARLSRGPAAWRVDPRAAASA